MSLFITLRRQTIWQKLSADAGSQIQLINETDEMARLRRGSPSSTQKSEKLPL